VIGGCDNQAKKAAMVMEGLRIGSIRRAWHEREGRMEQAHAWKEQGELLRSRIATAQAAV
jgi:hypothetical protein